MLPLQGYAPRFVVCALVGLSSGAICAQPYPNRPVRIITSEAGGGNDFATRIIAQGLTRPLGQQVVVDNRHATIGPAIVAQAAPDGHTLILSGSNFWISPLLRADTPYD